MSDDLLVLEEGEGGGQQATGAPWDILIVDDDREVHAVTRLALQDLVFRGRRLRFLSATSAAEAAGVLRDNRDVAVILLDVVMETDDAGLRLVREIRGELGLRQTRIVLRTGQPGSAPERSVVVDYDINDYKAKSELTEAKLFTTIISALRGYEDLIALEASRQGLEKIIEAAAELHRIRSLRLFGIGVLTQLAGILGATRGGIACAVRSGNGDALRMIAGSGRFESLSDDDLGRAVRGGPLALLQTAMDRRESLFGPSHAVVFLDGGDGRDVVIYVEAERPIEPTERQLLEVFATNIASGFANLELYDQLREVNETLERRVTKRTRALREREEMLKAILDASPVAVVLLRQNDFGIAFVNRRSVELLGLPEEALAGHLTPEPLFVEPAAGYRLLAELDAEGELDSADIPVRGAHGPQWVILNGRVFTIDKQPVRLLWLYELDRQEPQKADDPSLFDPVTGLASRRGFLREAQHLFLTTLRTGMPLVGISFVPDLSDDEAESLGQPVVDALLREIARACRTCIRSADPLGRMGEREFCLLLANADLNDAPRIVRRLTRAVRDLPAPDGMTAIPSLSVGVAQRDTADRTLDAFLARMDSALFEAEKGTGGRVEVAAAPH